MNQNLDRPDAARGESRKARSARAIAVWQCAPRFVARWHLIVLLIALTSCEKWALDRRMQELCDKDGGVKVYEAVELPAHMFDQNGDPFPGWRSRSPESRLSRDYIYTQTDTVLKEGDPLRGEGRLTRTERTIRRVSDQKMLGTSVIYGRAGGDLVVVDHFTSLQCPANQRSDDVIRGVFIRK